MTTIKELDERIKKLKQDMKELDYLQIEPSHCQIELKLLKEWRQDLIEKRDVLTEQHFSKFAYEDEKGFHYDYEELRFELLNELFGEGVKDK